MTERKPGRRFRGRAPGDHSDMITMCLRDGPLTVPEIEEQFFALGRRFGFFAELHAQEPAGRRTLTQEVLADLERMAQSGWVERRDDRYALTPLGHDEAGKRLAELQRFRLRVRKLLEPQTVPQVSLGVHLGLALIKLPAGLLSGSIGLINDAVDTLLDALSSLLVYAGFRFNKERAANVVLVLLMLGTGCLTFYEAVHRLFVPVKPQVDWFAFLATIQSALVCLALWAYQRYVGLRSGSLALIAQSVDSRNHVIVALSVTAGLIAALLHFPILDTLVGLAVAILILKSAVELGIETLRALGEGQVDLSRYRMGLMERYGQFRQAQLRDWMLYLVEKDTALTHAELRDRACQALDFSGVPALRELGLDGPTAAGEMVEQSLQELFDHGWLTADEPLRATDAGREHLRHLRKGMRSERHRPFMTGR